MTLDFDTIPPNQLLLEQSTCHSDTRKCQDHRGMVLKTIYMRDLTDFQKFHHM